MAAQGGMIMGKWAFWVLGLVISAHLVSVAHSVFHCNHAVPKLLPCRGYMLGGDPKPSDACCASFRNLDRMTTNHEVRFVLCECFKQGTAPVTIDFNKINQIPKLCNVPLHFTIDPDMECIKV